MFLVNNNCMNEAICQAYHLISIMFNDNLITFGLLFILGQAGLEVVEVSTKIILFEFITKMFHGGQLLQQTLVLISTHLNMIIKLRVKSRCSFVILTMLLSGWILHSFSANFLLGAVTFFLASSFLFSTTESSFSCWLVLTYSRHLVGSLWNLTCLRSTVSGPASVAGVDCPSMQTPLSELLSVELGLDITFWQWSYQDIKRATQRVVQNFTTWSYLPCLWC